MADYIPPTLDWVREQVELYEGSGGTEGTTLLDTGMPCILVTHTGNKTGGIRKIPLMRVEVNGSYALIGSMGGQPKNPVWVYNIRANPDVQIRDKTEVFDMRVREVSDEQERADLWKAAAEAYPPYDDYQAKTSRVIPVFIAEPLT
ncbi:MAG: nitroreductase family deazaflavin-dependent oxidoreductase [Pseudomonadales bacterium]